jgi:hypothetical protein
MEYDDFKESESDFIPGIFNYCDAWCEHCIYTHRCRSFASQKLINREIEADERRMKSNEESKNFWDQVNTAIEEAVELIDEVIPLVKGNEFPLFGQNEDDEEAEEAIKDYAEKREKAKNHNLTKVASKYEKAVHSWFEGRKDTLIVFDPDTPSLNFNYPGIVDELELIKLSDLGHVINWYHIQICVKVKRALTSYYEEQEDGNMFDGFPKDSDGSAMVALLGIDRSIGAWNFLRGKLISENESIKLMIRMLLWLRMEMEKEFPNAKDFEWPPNME